MRGFAFGIWALAFVAGLYGVYLRLTTGHELMGYSSYVPWGLGLALYVFFSGLSAGSFLVSASIHLFRIRRLEGVVRLGFFVALAALVAGLLTIWFDIGHMERFWEIFTTPSWSSPLAWMVWLYSVYAIVLVAALYLSLRPDLAQWSMQSDTVGKVSAALLGGRRDVSRQSLAASRTWLTVVTGVGLPIVIAFNGGLGALFGVLAARPYWNTSLFPLAFIVAALASSTALLAFISAFWGDTGVSSQRDMVTTLGRMTLGFVLLYLLFEVAEFGIALYAAVPQEVAPFARVLFGRYWWLFWGVHLGLGAVVPLVLLTWRSRSVAAVGVATGLVVIAFLAVRLNMIVPALIVPEFEGLDLAYMDPRLNFTYAPTSAEWLLNVFPAALAVALLYLGHRFLPLTTSARGEAAAPWSGARGRDEAAA